MILIHKHNLWELTSGIEPINSYFSDHISALEKQLRPIKDRFSLLPKSSYVELSCYLSSDTELTYPAIHLTSASVQFFASLGAEIDIDVR